MGGGPRCDCSSLLINVATALGGVVYPQLLQPAATTVVNTAATMTARTPAAIINTLRCYSASYCAA